MGGGILNGTILGLLVSGVVLAAVSLSTPLPEQPVAAVPAEAVPEPDPAAARGADPAPEAPAEDAPAPAEDASPPAADPAPEAPAPEAPAEDPAPDAPEPEPEAALTPGPAPRSALAGAGAEAVTLAAPAAPTQTATLPRIDTPPSATLLAPRAAAPAQDSAPAQSAPVAAPSPAIATVPANPSPPLPVSAPSPRFSSAADGSAGGTPPRRLISPQPQDTLAGIDTEPAPAPPEPEPTPAPEPETAPEPAAPVRADPEPEPADPPALAAVPESEPEPVAPRQLPQVAAVPRGPAPATPAPSLASRLPQAGVTATPEPEAAPEVVAEEPAPAPPNALADNAEAFDAPEGNPLLAVVLIDDPDSPIEPAALASFTFPVSFAIDPMRPDAGARAAELRAAGHEVVILGAAAIPDGAAPGDVEVALAVARETVPQAVALMDDAESRIQGDRPVLDATVGTLAESGHGLIAFPRGLNAAEETARRTGVPAVTVFRLLDDADQSAPVITRYLGRAAFAAAQEGAVVVVGHSRPDTVTALFSWALGSRTEGVDLAPVSAVLRRLSE